jgi:DNA repair exonuclease SbcCD ATPase subunit
LEEERQTLTVELATKNSDIESSSREIASLKSALVSLQNKLGKSATDTDLLVSGSDHGSSSITLDLEKELRMKAELREERERIEKISALAQLDAMSAQHRVQVKELELQIEELRKSLRDARKDNNGSNSVMCDTGSGDVSDPCSN